MDLSTITVADFKAKFFRDFPYLSAITYDSSETYNAGDEVYYPTSNLFYSALQDGLTGVTPGSDNLKWAKYADSLTNWIMDADITNAFAEAQVCFNQALLGTDDEITLGYLYMVAHYLCIDIRNSFAGIQGTGGFPVASRSVGSVAESYQIPEAFRENPTLAMYAQTSYGQKYLALVLPKTVGNMVAVLGGTNA